MREFVRMLKRCATLFGIHHALGNGGNSFALDAIGGGEDFDSMADARAPAEIRGATSVVAAAARNLRRFIRNGLVTVREAVATGLLTNAQA